MPKTYDKYSQQLTVPEHFYRPPSSRSWYVRLVPPRHVQHLVGKREFRKSTGHADLKRAIPVGSALIADKLLEWDSLARSLGADKPTPRVLTLALVEDLCAARLYSWTASDEEDRNSGLSDAELVDIETFCKLTDRAMRSVLAQGPASGEWREAVSSVLDWACVQGYELDASDPLFPKLVREFARVEREAQKLIGLKNQGESPPAPPSVLPRLSSVTDEYKKHKAIQGDPKYVSTLLHTWRLFIEHCGDMQFDSVTQADVYGFFHARVHASVKPWSLSRARTFGKRVLREVFAFAKVQGLMNVSNPLDGFETFPALSKEDEASRREPRYPFTSKQLNSLFQSSWYDPNEDAHFQGKMREDLGARYWVPLLGLLHGNRVREALQLVASDFQRDTDGNLVIRFQTKLESSNEDGDEDAEAQELDQQREQVAGPKRSLKTKASHRTVPVHPLLIELGFEAFVQKRRDEDGRNALLFPSSEPNAKSKSPKLGRSYEQAFLRYVRDRLAFGSGHGNHSFRHQLEDRIRDAQAKTGLWPAGLGQQYTGRKVPRKVDQDSFMAQGSEAAYGHGYSAAAMLPHIRKLDFSDVVLPLTFDNWIGHIRKTTP